MAPLLHVYAFVGLHLPASVGYCVSVSVSATKWWWLIVWFHVEHMPNEWNRDFHGSAFRPKVHTGMQIDFSQDFRLNDMGRRWRQFDPSTMMEYLSCSSSHMQMQTFERNWLHKHNTPHCLHQSVLLHVRHRPVPTDKIIYHLPQITLLLTSQQCNSCEWIWRFEGKWNDSIWISIPLRVHKVYKRNAESHL